MKSEQEGTIVRNPTAGDAHPQSGGNLPMTGAQFVRLAAAAVAAILFVFAGNEMRDIKSVSGDSIAKAFYQAVGLFSYGMAALSVAIGLPHNWLRS